MCRPRSRQGSRAVGGATGWDHGIVWNRRGRCGASLNRKLAAGPSGLCQYLLYVNALIMANSRLRLLRGEGLRQQGGRFYRDPTLTVSSTKGRTAFASHATGAEAQLDNGRVARHPSRKQWRYV
jgi:hypothetical protein